MSGIAGVFMRSGAPASLEVAARMAAITPYRGAQATRPVSDGAFAAVQQISHTGDAPSEFLVPARDDASGLTVLFDGRLDNREALIDVLDARACHERTDAWLALRAWQQWGELAAGWFEGDFAFVVWDGRNQSVFCARDAMGVRPLFYTLTDEAFVFGSEVRQVLEYPGARRGPDEEMVAALLSGALPRANDRTLYAGIRRLPHGHGLHVRRRSAARQRWWSVDLGRELKLSSDAEYAEAFRDVFERAVRARVPGREPIGAYLSGGLDSSSVVVTARAVADPARSIATFSLVFPGHPAADEREYSEAVVRHSKVDGEWLNPRGIDLDTARLQVAARRELPDFPHDYAGECVRLAMRRRGIRVALTGSGGDVGLSGSHYHYADLVRRGRLIRFCRRYLDVARQPAMHWLRADVLRCAAWPLLPVPVRRAIRPFARRTEGSRVPSWIAPRLTRNVAHFDVPPLREIPPGQLARTDVHDAFDNGWMHMALDLYQRASAERGIDDRHPFFDRRVVEFSLSLPDEQRWQRGRTRYVLRRAFSGRLPDVVRDRPDAGKGDLSHLYERALVAIGGRDFFADSLEVAARGWVVAREARRLYDRMRAQHARQDAGYGDTAFRLWNIAALELWHQGVFGTGRTSWIDQSTSDHHRSPESADRGRESLTGAPC